MITALYTPSPEEAVSGSVPEEVSVEGPARAHTGLAFVVLGLETGRRFLAWADELVAAPAGVTA